MKKIMLVSLFLFSTTSAFAAVSDEFTCRIRITDNITGEIISDTSADLAAIRKPTLDLPPSTEARLSMKTDISNNIGTRFDLIYKHIQGSGVEKAWQNACFTTTAWDENRAMQTGCMEPSQLPPGNGWTEVSLNQGIPAFNSQKAYLSNTMIQNNHHITTSCQHKNTIP